MVFLVQLERPESKDTTAPWARQVQMDQMVPKEAMGHKEGKDLQVQKDQLELTEKQDKLVLQDTMEK